MAERTLRDALLSEPYSSSVYEDIDVKRKKKEAEEEGPGVLGTIGDVALSLPRGVAGAVEEIAEVGNIIPGVDYNLGDDWLGTSKTGIGSLTEGITSFAVGFVGTAGLGVAGKVGKAAKLSKAGKARTLASLTGKKLKSMSVKEAAAYGAVADFAVFDGHDARLSNLIEAYPALQNPITEYLASDMTDSELEGRLKNAVEGLALGGILEVLISGIRKIRKTKQLRSEGKSPEEIVEATQKEQAQVENAVDQFNGKQAKQPTTVTKTEAEEVPVVVEPKKEAAVDPVAATKASRNKIKTASLEEAVKFANENDAIAGIDRLNELYKEEGVLINLNAFSNSKQLSDAAVNFVEQNYKGIKELKDEIQLSKENQELLEAEWTDLGLDSGQAVGLVTKQQDVKAELFAKTALLRAAKQGYADTLTNIIKLREQLKTASKGEALQVEQALEIEKAKYLAYGPKLKTLAAVVGAARSEVGKTLRSLRTMDEMEIYLTEENFSKTPKAASDYIDATLISGKSDRETLDKALDKALEVYDKHGINGLGKVSPVTSNWDIHNELWINSLLSGPRTAVINALGNLFTSVFLPIEKALGAHLMYRNTGKAEFLIARNEIFRISSLLGNYKEALELGKRAFREEDSILQSRSSAIGEFNRGPAISQQTFSEAGGPLKNVADYFGTKVDFVGKNIVRLPSRFLQGTDEFFKQLQFRHTAQTESMIKAHEMLRQTDAFKNGESIPNEILSRKAAEIFDGLVRTNGERFSRTALKREGLEHLKKVVETERAKGNELDGLTKLNIVEQYVDSRLGELGKAQEGISDRAFFAAQEATFTRPQEGIIGKKIQEMVVQAPWLRTIMPFVSTPLNIIKFFGDRTLPMDNRWTQSLGLHKRYMDDLNDPNPLVQAAAKGRMAAGAMLWTSAMLAASSGLITGFGPRRKAEREVLKQTGWQPYSIKTPVGYVSYQRFDPFATFFGLTADMFEFMRESGHHVDEQPIQDLLMSIGIGLSQNVLNKSYMTGVQQAIEAASDPQGSLEGFAKVRAGSYVPSFFGQMVGTLDGDPALREARSVLDGFIKRVPGGARSLDPKRNVLGEVAEKGGWGVGVADYVVPFMRSEKRNDALFSEMAKASHAFSMPSLKLAGKIDLSETANDKGQSAYDRMMELQATLKVNGKTLRQRLNQLIESKQFQSLSEVPIDGFDTPRANAIKRVISKYRKLAKKRMLSEFPNVEQQVNLVEQISFYQKAGDQNSVDQLIQQLKGLR